MFAPLSPAFAVVPCMLALASSVHGRSFVPGHIYAPTDGGWVLEFDSQLRQVGQFLVPGVETATGTAFNTEGNLVFIARHNQLVKLLEVDSNGNILDSYATGSATLLRGSYVDQDPTTGLYAIADDDRVTMLDRDLNWVASTEKIFTRATGVAFSNKGTILALDSFTPLLSEFDAGGQLIGQQSVGGWVNAGMDLTSAGDVLFTSFGEGAVYQVDSSSGSVTTVLDGFGFGQISDVVTLPNDQFLVVGTAGPLYLYNSQWQLMEQTNDFESFGDSAAYFIPSPGVWAAMALAFAIKRRKRHRRRPSPSWRHSTMASTGGPSRMPTPPFPSTAWITAPRGPASVPL